MTAALLRLRRDARLARVVTPSVVGAFVVATLIFIASIPITLPPLYVLVAVNIMVTTIFAMSFNLLYGYTGMFSFGQAAFYGLGAYATALLINNVGLGFFLSLIIASLLTALFGLVVGVLVVGLERIAFIMLTFAIAELLGYGANRAFDITRGGSGLIVNVPSWLNVAASTNTVYYVVAGIFVLVIALLFVLTQSAFGLIIQATRENPERALTVGVDVWRVRLIAFVVSALIAGIAGSVSALTTQIIYPSAFGWLISANALIITLLGGAGYFYGPILGGVVLGLIGLYAGRYTTNIDALNGVLFLAIILLAPKGVGGLIHGTQRRLASVSGHPNG